MSHLVIPKIECIECTDVFGRFNVEPLEKGIGVNLGNSMRRIMLGYLQGAAVTWVKIEEIQHEFTTINHVKEDAIELLLNVKGLRLKPVSVHPGKLSLKVSGEGRVTAADIEPSADFEIVNPELYLATLDSAEAVLNIEFNIELGTGYQQAESKDSLLVGAIPLDAIFTPIQKVNFTVEPIHVGKVTSKERLIIEVWTDGTIAPGDAISQGANLLIEQLSPFVKQTKAAPPEAVEEKPELPIAEEKYNMPLQQLNLSVRTMNCLRRAGITTVGGLVGKTEKELLSLRNFGEKSKNEIVEALKQMDLTLAPG